MRFCSKLPCSKKVNGKRYLIHDSKRFQKRTEFLYSCSRQVGLIKFSIPSRSFITDRISFWSTHGERRSHIRGDEGPFDPTNDGEELCTQK